MKLAIRIILAMHLAGVGCMLTAQDCASTFAPPSADSGYTCRMFGDVRVGASQTSEWTAADLRTRLLGKPDDIIPTENARFRVKNDVLIMGLGFYTRRDVEPVFARLGLTSYSSTPSKYEKNSTLTISHDDKPLFSERMRMTNSIGIAETFTLEIKYADFLKLINTKKVTVQFGETLIEFNSDTINALGALLITRKLKPPPPPPWM